MDNRRALVERFEISQSVYRRDPWADLSTPAVIVLLLATAVGVVPTGRFARQRALTAPAFAGAAAYALLWDPDPLHQPAIIGAAALALILLLALLRG